MSSLVFLGIAAGLSVLGCLVLWVRSRQPRSMDAHIREFSRELDALAPGSPLDRPSRRPPPERGTGPGPDEGPERRRGPEWPPDPRRRSG